MALFAVAKSVNTPVLSCNTRNAVTNFFASDSKKLPAVTLISNGTYDLEKTMPSS